MIEIILEYAGEVILVKIEGHNVTFGNTVYGAQMATIEGLKLSKAGVIKEFPDLKDNVNWRVAAIDRFKNKINLLATEDEIYNYVLNDLKKFGYKPLYRQKKGFRREVIK